MLSNTRDKTFCHQINNFSKQVSEAVMYVDYHLKTTEAYNPFCLAKPILIPEIIINQHKNIN